MPRFIIITETSTELLDGTLADLQRRVKILAETTGKVPMWAQTGSKQKPKYKRPR